MKSKILSEDQQRVYRAIDRIVFSVEPRIRVTPEGKLWLYHFETMVFDTVRGHKRKYPPEFLKDYLSGGEFPELAMLGVDPDYVKRCLNETGVEELRCH